MTPLNEHLYHWQSIIPQYASRSHFSKTGTPLLFVFVLFQTNHASPISAHPILDPTHLETLLSSSLFSLSLTNVTSPAPSLCVLHKAGGIPLTVQEISYCVQVAVTRAKELGIWLQGKLDADWGLRKELVEVR